MSSLRWVAIPFVAALVSAPATAGLIPVAFQEAVISGPTVVTPSTTLLSSAVPNIRLKFFVPNYWSIVSLNSVNVMVQLFDDGDVPADNGNIVFVLNGAGLSNFQLDSFSSLNGATFASPYTSSTSVQSADLANVLTEIQGDGYFFVRVNRNPPGTSDFYVKGATVTIDADVAIPEPGTASLIGLGLAAGAMIARRRARAA